MSTEYHDGQYCEDIQREFERDNVTIDVNGSESVAKSYR